METRAHFVLVGTFVLFLAGCVAVVVLWLARVEFERQTTLYDIYLTGSVTGLVQGSPVRDNGILVGHVTDVQLDPQDPTRVRVTIETAATTVFKTDSIASFEIQGLTGGAYINITGGSRDAPPLVRQPGERYPVVASAPSELQRMVASGPEVLARIVVVANQLSQILNERNQQAIAETLENMRRVSATVASHSGEIDGALSDGAQALHELRNTLETANAILTTLNQFASPSGDMATTFRSVSDTSRRIAEASGDMAATFRSVGETSRRIADVAAQSQLLVQQLSRIADTVERDPTRLLYGDRREGYQPK